MYLAGSDGFLFLFARDADVEDIAAGVTPLRAVFRPDVASCSQIGMLRLNAADPDYAVKIPIAGNFGNSGLAIPVARPGQLDAGAPPYLWDMLHPVPESLGREFWRSGHVDVDSKLADSLDAWVLAAGGRLQKLAEPEFVGFGVQGSIFYQKD